jgi:hypothetical protein
MNKLRVFIGILGLTCTTVFAMNTQGTNEQDIEVIEVVGQFSKAQWERIAESAKVDFYELFNQYNDIEKFRMVCRPTNSVFTRIKRQVCEPMYYKNEVYLQTQTGMAMGGAGWINFNMLNTGMEINPVIKKSKKEADAHMEKLINEHPDLRKKFEYFAKAKAASELRATLDY